jgi:hypothetical protein
LSHPTRSAQQDGGQVVDKLENCTTFFSLERKETKVQGSKSLAKNEIRYAMEIKLVPISYLK